MNRISTLMISERSLTAMLAQQSKLSDTQLQLSSGKRVLTAADDPASAARVLGLRGAVETVKQYQDNVNWVQSRLESEEGVLDGVTNLLQRANELAIQGNNSVLTQTDTTALAAEIRQLQEQLFSMANSRDGNGEYMFAGFQSNTQPFSNPVAGSYTYSGDLGQRMLQISPDRQIADGNNGFEVFMDVETGPVATVTTAAATTFGVINAGDITIDGGNGNGAVSLGGIPAAANATERANQLRDAINAVSGETGVRAEKATAGTLTLTAVGGTGVVIALSGTNTATDSGLVDGTTPSVTSKRNIFETLDQLATKLESNGPVDQYIEDVQLALDKIVGVRTTVGARLNAIEAQQEVNTDLELVLETHRSAEEDLDYTEAITRFDMQQVALEAAQKAYVKVQGLSLFNFL